jgi:hypothetical protein
MEYLHLNPVRAGLVSRLEDWRWSSCSAGVPTRVFEMTRQQMLRVDRRPRENALRPARTNLLAPSQGPKDADHKSAGPRYARSTGG